MLRPVTFVELQKWGHVGAKRNVTVGGQDFRSMYEAIFAILIRTTLTKQGNRTQSYQTFPQ